MKAFNVKKRKHAIRNNLLASTETELSRLFSAGIQSVWRKGFPVERPFRKFVGLRT